MTRTFSAVLLGLALSIGNAFGATVGQPLPKVTISDANNAPATIPDLGTKVLAMFINDPDAADLNDPMADKLKAANLDKSVYRGVGIAILQDTVLPNSMVRAIIRKKIEKYNATILTVTDNSLNTAWGLGDTNGTSMVMIVDKQGVLRYQKKGAMTPAEIESTYQLVLQLMAQ